MTTLMGENMMRKDGEAHQTERRTGVSVVVAANSSRNHWRAPLRGIREQQFSTTLDRRETIDLVRDYAMPVSGKCLREITGLTGMTPEEMDASSQGMIDGMLRTTSATRKWRRAAMRRQQSHRSPPSMSRCLLEVHDEAPDFSHA